MEARPAFSIERSSSNQLNNIGMSGALPSSLSVHPTPLEETYPRFSDSQPAFVEKDSLPSFLDFSVNASIDNSQVESSACNIMATEEFPKRNDWQEWADQLISDD
ncbi:two-component response regulator ARR, partial [Trifolium pratense]